MLIFTNAIKIPSKEVAKEIFDSKDGKNFMITGEILTYLCLNNMASILKTAITSRIRITNNIAMNRRKYRVLITVSDDGKSQEVDMAEDSDEWELPPDPLIKSLTSHFRGDLEEYI